MKPSLPFALLGLLAVPLHAQAPAGQSRADLVKARQELDSTQKEYTDLRSAVYREINRLAWNLFRDQLILEYEIPKYEGDLTPPNAYVAVSASVARRKVGHLGRHFSSQRKKDWFVADNFLGLMRLRGMESRSPSGFAEAFHVRKLVL